ncbi:MinD-like ATPase involved in chromosome partitioning or flagellar assembly [Streptosporangium canum]|uniref:MinD-like ATPase involved in chromosome partitioning or flagellar assembly n=1 Tax=Streptosporangium canum TaxID=324952 RepID=A0A1I3X1H7_9ACTN|nr:TcpE family conjugal transfer membrane protein [Streptosporangium canum]SFK13420.1 MinD-like ATPase involved in chromosome partitioning or flagellar assembly [Streptosporangium canum]
MDLPTYTNIWRIEKRLYKLYDLRLPMPLPIVWIGVFVGVVVPWSLLLYLLGLPFDAPWHVVYLVPPGIVTWLSTRPVIESKRLTELLQSQARYVGEPRTWCRMAPASEPSEISLTGRVWQAAPQREAPVRVKASRRARHAQSKRAAAREVRPAVAAAAAAAAAAPVARERTAWGTAVAPRRGTAPALGQAVSAEEPGAVTSAARATSASETHAPPASAIRATSAAAVPVEGVSLAPPPAASAALVKAQADPAPAASTPTTSPAPAAGQAPAGPAAPPQQAPAAPAEQAPAAPIGTEALRRLRRLAASAEAERAVAVQADQGRAPAGAASSPPAQPEVTAEPEATAEPAERAASAESAASADRLVAGEPSVPVAGPRESAGRPEAVPGSVVPLPQRPAAVERGPGAVERPAAASGPVVPLPQRPAAVERSAAAAGSGDSAEQPPAEQMPADPRFVGPAPSRRRAAEPEVQADEAAEGLWARHRKGQPAPAEQFAETQRTWPQERPGGTPAGVSIRAVPARTEAKADPVMPAVPVPRPGQGEARVRRVESVVGRDSSGGWRRLAQVVIGPGAGRMDGAEIDEARARTVFGGSRRVVVLGCTGGAGQTTTALMLGHTLARYREDRVLAVDANIGIHPLSSRIQGESPETLSSLLAGLDNIHGYLGMRAYTSRCASGLEVIAGDSDSGAEQRLADRTLFSDRRLSQTMNMLDRHYKLIVMDPAAALAARVLPYADQLVLVVPASEDGPDAVAMTYEWLDGHGCADLRRRAIMVVNGVSRRSMGDVEQAEAVARGRCRAIVRVPWEDELAPGRSERVEPSHLRAPGRRAYLALAGVVVAGFGAAQTVRPSEEELAQ